MHPDLSQELLHVLTDEGQLSLPELGTFRLLEKSASVSTIEGRTRPPSKIVEFNNNLILDDGRLVRHLRDRQQISTEKARESIDNYVAGLQAEIASGKMVTLSGLGRLFKDHSGEVRFNAGDHNLDKQSFGLPDVALTPVIRTERNPIAASVAGAHSFKSSIPPPNSLEDLQSEPAPMTVIWGWVRDYIWAIALVTAFIFVIGMYYVNQRDRELELSKMERTTPPPPNDRVNVAPPPEDIGPVEPVIVQPPPTINEAPPTNNLPPEEGYAIIRLYQFRSDANVRKNLRKISEAGYEPFTKEENKLTQVGIQVRFRTERELNEVLSDIRSRFSQDAFVQEKNGQRYQQ